MPHFAIWFLDAIYKIRTSSSAEGPKIETEPIMENHRLGCNETKPSQTNDNPPMASTWGIKNIGSAMEMTTVTVFNFKTALFFHGDNKNYMTSHII